MLKLCESKSICYWTTTMREAIRLPSKISTKGLRYDLLVIFRSDTDDGPWTALRAGDVPDWLKNDPEVVGKMRSGYMCRNGDTGPWYRAERTTPRGVIIH